MDFLLKKDGKPFSPEELEQSAAELEKLPSEERKTFRDENAKFIANDSSSSILIVSGPGTGKSHLFLSRIGFWLNADPDAEITVISFVKKLVDDLEKDTDSLAPELKRKISCHTLHRLARSLVETNHGSADWQFKPFLKMITQEWKHPVWDDTVALSDVTAEEYSLKKFEDQLHVDRFEDSEIWRTLKQNYYSLCRLYNAAGFPDIILRAKDAVRENADLVTSKYFIVDEYQDFNQSEKNLLDELSRGCKGILVAGDDDQSLYEELKRSDPAIIRNLYADHRISNAMLPFCGRCDHDITGAAQGFLEQTSDAASIKKIYLPLQAEVSAAKVSCVGCMSPDLAVDYIEQFIEAHHADIQKRMEDLARGQAKDSYLLILSQTIGIKYLHLTKNSPRDRLLAKLKEFGTERDDYCEDYEMILTYFLASKNHEDNFELRKVFQYENFPTEKVCELNKKALSEGENYVDLGDGEVGKISNKVDAIAAILGESDSLDDKIEKISALVEIKDKLLLHKCLEEKPIGAKDAKILEEEKEALAEMTGLQEKPLAAVELLTIVGAKGLSADHVIILGCDDVNMSHVSRNAFFVAITRARRTLHLLISLRAGGSSRPHEFISHLSEENVSFSSYKKSDHSLTIRGKDGLYNYLESIQKMLKKVRS